jgi:hypothetical protein
MEATEECEGAHSGEGSVGVVFYMLFIQRGCDAKLRRELI